MNTYEYLLQDINSINGIGNKTSKLFKKKILIQYLICYGVCQEILLIEAI